MYEITALGKSELQDEERRWYAVTAAVGHILERV
jgi:hypothetical protein